MAAGRSFNYLTDEERKDTHKWAHYLAELEAHKPIRNFRFATYFDNKEHWVAISADPHFDEQGCFRGIAARSMILPTWLPVILNSNEPRSRPMPPTGPSRSFWP